MSKDLEFLWKRLTLGMKHGYFDVIEKNKKEILLGYPRSDYSRELCLKDLAKSLEFPLSSETLGILEHLKKYHAEDSKVSEVLEKAVVLELEKAIQKFRALEIESGKEIFERVKDWGDFDEEAYEGNLKFAECCRLLRGKKFTEAREFLVNWKSDEVYLEFFYEATIESFCAQGMFLETQEFLLDWELDGVYLKRLESVRESYYKNLKIESDPADAGVWEGETLLGNTPLDLKLLQGEHEITVKSEGRTSQTQRILLREKEQTASFQLSMYEIHFPCETSPCTVATYSNSVGSTVFSPDGKYAAVNNGGNFIKIYRTSDWQELSSYQGNSDWGSGTASFSPDSQFLVFSHYQSKNDLALFLSDFQIIKRFEGHSDRVNSVSFSPDGKFILSGSDDQTVKLWNLAGDLRQTFNGHSDRVNSVSFSPDGKFILSGSSDYTVKLWNLAGDLQQTFEGDSSDVTSVSFSPDGKFILSGSDDKTVKLWNLAGDLQQTFEGHSDYVNSVSFSPDGKFILSGSEDHTVKLWNLAGDLQQTFNGHSDYVNSVSFSPDGKFILSGSGDQTVRLWRLLDHVSQKLRVYLKKKT